MRFGKKKIIILITIWLVFAFANHYYLPYYVQPFSWFFVCITLLVLLVAQFVRTFNERKNLKANRILNLSATFLLFFLTSYRFNEIPDLIIEKIDWTIFCNMRKQIVKEALTDKLVPNTTMDNGICKLPFAFPIISNGGNEILIYKNRTEESTVKFWISRGFFESPQIYFIFTNDNETKKHYEELIKKEPVNNWKLEENWFRIVERD